MFMINCWASELLKIDLNVLPYQLLGVKPECEEYLYVQILLLSLQLIQISYYVSNNNSHTDRSL